MKKANPIGTAMTDLFDELQEREELDLLTRKKLIAEQINDAMQKQGWSKAALAEAMHTSRTVVHRLLNPMDTSITLATLAKVSKALRLQLNVSLSRVTNRVA